MKILVKNKENDLLGNMIDAYKDHYGQACAVVVYGTGEVDEVLFKNLTVLDSDFIPKKESKQL